MTFQYTPEYEKLINFSISLGMAFDSDEIPEDQRPQNERLRTTIENAFASLVKIVQPYRNELAAFFYHDSARLSLFSEWRLKDFIEKGQSATIDTTIEYIEKMSMEDWTLSVLKRYGSSSLSAEGFYFELLRNPSLLITYIQSLDVPDPVKLGIIRATTAAESQVKTLIRFLVLYREAFNNVYASFSGWIEPRTEELESILPSQFDLIFEQLPGARINQDKLKEVCYGSLVFSPLNANDTVLDNTVFISIGLASTIFEDNKQIGQLETIRAFKYLDEPKHVAILKALLGGELCVMDILTSIKDEYTIPQPTLSGYLQDLLEMGAVKRHYEGVKCYYEIDPAFVEKGKAYFDTFGKLLREGEKGNETEMA